MSLLKNLTIRNGDLESLNGIQGSKNIEKIYLKDAKIGDYSNIPKLQSLTTIYICLTDAVSEEDANEQIRNFTSVDTF
ncbi:MAG: hypothetical protein IJ867_00580 [Clostridia bacterium]|nr:hypothetical protein [Clostridia bacterium]